jgi:hypothetical protein
MTAVELKLGKFEYDNDFDLAKCSVIRMNDGIYRGEVVCGERHGQGVFIWNDGSKYEGNWSNDKCNGFGRYISCCGDVYIGQWLNGKWHGKGALI